MKKIKLTPGTRAEQAGADLGLLTLNCMLAGSDQSERLESLRHALQQLHADRIHSERRIGGFCGVLVNVLEKGLGLDRVAGGCHAVDDGECQASCRL